MADPQTKTNLASARAEKEDFDLVSLRRLFQDYEDSGAFHTLVNLAGFVDDYAFITKSGEVGVALSIAGVDAECLESDSIEAITANCRSALRVFNEQFIINTFLMKRAGVLLECGQAVNPVVRAAVEDRHTFLAERAGALYSFDLFMTILIKPDWKSPLVFDRVSAFFKNPVEVTKRILGSKTRTRLLDQELDRSIRALYQSANGFVEQTRDALHVKVLPKEEAFLFFRRMLNPDQAKAEAIPLTEDAHVDYFAVDSELECYRDHLRLDNYVIKSLTLKQLPSRTFGNMFAALSKVKADLVFVTEWQVENTATAISDIRSKRRHAHNTKLSLTSHLGSERPSERELLFDESKEAVVADLGECLKAIEMRGIQLGDFSLTVLVIAKSFDEAERAVAEVMKVVGTYDGAMNEERYNGMNVFVAAIPGGHPYNLRKNIVTNENHADLVPWFQPSAGEPRNEFLGEGYLAAFETEDQSLYRFNLHVQDVGHTLILGPTGSGKTFQANFLVTHAQQYEPYTFIFDVGRSYRGLTDLLGGSFVPFKPEFRSFTINPFCLDPTSSNLEFIFAFMKLLVESDGFRMTDAQERELFSAISSIYVLEPEHRRLLTLSTTVSRTIGERLKRWTEGEQYGQWFDNVADTVTFVRFQCIDFEGMERLGIVLEPLLFYLLHRVNEVIYDPALATTFKLAVFDEAWLFFRHPTTQDYIGNAIRTWRKKNAAMILSTQTLQDLAGNEVFQPVLENCPTKLLLSNPTLDRDFYTDVLRLNSVEVEKVRHLIPKQQFLLKREGLSKVLNLNVDRKSYWLFTTNPYEAKRRQDLVAQIGLAAALEKLARGD